MNELVLIKKEIRSKVNHLNYITHQDTIIKRTSEYNRNHRPQINSRRRDRYADDPEYRNKEIQRVLDYQRVSKILKGLCHVCFASNVEVSVPDGIPICSGCLNG